MRRTPLALLCLTLPVSAAASEAAPGVDPVAWIAASEADGVATLDVLARFPQAAGGHFALSIDKWGNGTHAGTRQSGTLGPRPDGIAVVAHNTHSFGEADRIVIDLAFTAADGTVRRERMTLGGAED